MNGDNRRKKPWDLLKLSQRRATGEVTSGSAVWNIAPTATGFVVISSTSSHPLSHLRKLRLPEDPIGSSLASYGVKSSRAVMLEALYNL
jgi:hypothetical protein